MKKWILTLSKDGIEITAEMEILSNTEPGFWDCQAVADDEDCEFWTLEEAGKV